MLLRLMSSRGHPPGAPSTRMAAWVVVLAVVAALLLAGCELHDGAQERLVTAEVVRANIYVAPSGDDSDPGTRTEPFRTLARAAQVATAGTTVHVAPGTYAGGVRSIANGTAEARIIFQSSVRGAARIAPQLDAHQPAAWDNRGDYVDIIGFDIDGSQYQSGMKWLTGIHSSGAHNGVHHNRIHHIGTDVPCDSRGGAGIAAGSADGGSKTDSNSALSGNTVHDIGPPGCPHMHGIAAGARASLRNNVVYRVSGAGIHLWHGASHVSVHANTVAACGIGILVGDGDSNHGRGLTDYTEVSNNIVVDNGVGIIERGATGPHNTFVNNLVHANPGGDWRLADGRRHTGSIDAPPRFVDYTRDGVPDFRLLPGSPAIGEPPTGAAARAPPGAAGQAPRAAIGALPVAAP